MSRSGAGAPGKPAKPVTPSVECLWDDAKTERDWLRLLRFWQNELARIPPDVVLAPAATDLNHRWLARFKPRAGMRWMDDGVELVLPTTPLVPCGDCGLVFESHPPRFATKCASCGKRGKPKAPTPPAGDLQMYSRGFYPKGPCGPSWGYSHLCEHPECVEFFLAVRSQERYCPVHKNRTAAMRARERTEQPKHERFRLLAAESVHVTYHLEDGSARVCNVGPAGYQARDENEFAVVLGQPMINAEKL